MGPQWNFIENLVKVFPSLAKRPLHLTGESYAGTYIVSPSAARKCVHPHSNFRTAVYHQDIFRPHKPPHNSRQDRHRRRHHRLWRHRRAPPHSASPVPPFFPPHTLTLPQLSIIETYPQLIGYDEAVYSWFKDQSHLCGYDLNLTYPQTGGYFPDLQFIGPSDPLGPGLAGAAKRHVSKRAFVEDVNGRLAKRGELGDQLRKRDLTGRSNGTIDSWYGCDLYNALLSYAVNYTYPWSKHCPFSIYSTLSDSVCRPATRKWIRV